MLGTILYVVELTVLTFLTIRAPHIALVAILCMFGLDQLGQLYIQFLRSNGMFTNAYVLFLTGTAIIHAYFKGHVTLRSQFQDCRVRNLALMLFLFAFISLAWSPFDGGLKLWALEWPYLVVSVIMAPALINKLEDLEDVQRTFIWVGGALAVFLAFVPDWKARAVMVPGSSEGIKVPLALAELSGYLLIAATIYLKKEFLSIAWLALVVISALMVAVNTQSRGQLIFSILSFAAVAPFVWKQFSPKQALKLALTGVALVLISSYILNMSDIYKGRWETAELFDDLGQRFEMTGVLLSEWITSPLAIVFGLGNSASISPTLVGRYPHIVIMEVLGEEGIVGFTLFAMLVLIMVRQARLFNRLKFLSVNIRKSYAICFGWFLYTFLLSFKQGSLISTPMMFFFAVVCEKYFHLVKFAIYRGEYQSHLKARVEP